VTEKYQLIKFTLLNPVIVRIVSILDLASLSILELFEYNLERREINYALSEGVVVIDRHETASETDFEQVVKEQNADTVRSLPGATLIQDTDCTKYVIDGIKACSMIYHQGMTDRKEMEVDFQTGKQSVSMSILGSDFDKYLPIANQMLNSMKAA
jgi:hypothetical protein